MRYPKDQKETTRQSLLAASGSFAKEHGFFSSGVDALASAAGVTSGALYRHFDGKAGLFSAVVDAEIEKSLDRFSHLPPEHPIEFEKAIAGYLSTKHVAKPSEGCMLPAMTAEVSRADGATRQRFQEGVQEMKDLIGQFTRDEDAAWALLAQSVGAVMLARAMTDESVQKECLRAVRRNASDLVKR
ncbi:MAG: TetR/AcrR family transcriptional regulator [Proteobacteria bacterium]|nr:TetR/AcrR family transcriptional regulator [Pseudomonadota bacterium]